MNLIALGINHNSAAVEVRERVAFAPEQVGEALGDACEQCQVEEVVILSRPRARTPRPRPCS
jgi:glutamyl-tRNA reductase